MVNEMLSGLALTFGCCAGLGVVAVLVMNRLVK